VTTADWAGNPDDLWVTLNSSGYNHQLQQDESGKPEYEPTKSTKSADSPEHQLFPARKKNAVSNRETADSNRIYKPEYHLTDKK
jgi:hypothetical protein